MAEVVAATAPSEVHIKSEEKPTLTPPASEGTDKHYDSGSDLSELEAETVEKADEEVVDHGEIKPDHYYEGGKIPVFKPVSAPHLQHFFHDSANKWRSEIVGSHCGTLKLTNFCFLRQWANSAASRHSSPRLTSTA